MTEPIFDDKGNEVKPVYAKDVVAGADSGLHAVINAWTDAGYSQALQDKAKENLKKDWPTLYLALERLVEEHEGFHEAKTTFERGIEEGLA